MNQKFKKIIKHAKEKNKRSNKSKLKTLNITAKESNKYASCQLINKSNLCIILDKHKKHSALIIYPKTEFKFKRGKLPNLSELDEIKKELDSKFN